MRIDQNPGLLFLDALASRAKPAQASAVSAQASPARVAETSATSGDGVRRVDFSAMTRKELLDWVNGEILGGRMTLDESTPLIGLTLKVDARTQQPVDIATDATRENFVGKTQLGIAGARWRKDVAEEKWLQSALDIMMKKQGSVIGVDTRV